MTRRQSFFAMFSAVAAIVAAPFMTAKPKPRGTVVYRGHKGQYTATQFSWRPVFSADGKDHLYDLCTVTMQRLGEPPVLPEPTAPRRTLLSFGQTAPTAKVTKTFDVVYEVAGEYRFTAPKES